MLGRCRRQRANIKTTVGECLVFAGMHNRIIPAMITQQTQNICILFIQDRPNVFDVGPTLYKCYTNVLCLLGSEDWLIPHYDGMCER